MEKSYRSKEGTNLKTRISALEKRIGVNDEDKRIRVIHIWRTYFPDYFGHGRECMSSKRQYDESKKKNPNWTNEFGLQDIAFIDPNCIGCSEQCPFTVPAGTDYEEAGRIIKQKEAELLKIKLHKTGPKTKKSKKRPLRKQ